MLFFQFSFLFVFLPVVLLVDRALPGPARNLWLLLASFAFYGAFSLEYLPLLLISILIDFIAARRMDASDEDEVRRRWLAVSLIVNLGLLAGFKYAGFVSGNLRALFGEAIPVIEAALPVGISFYTFQTMSYSIDVYRRRVEPARSLIDFATYVALFPQLVAGPIVRFAQLRLALESRTRADGDAVVRGLVYLSVGLAKKLLVADSLARYADPIFSRGDVGLVDGWVSMILYAGQIYFDFSGYSDMAIGLGALLGLSFPINFDEPYRATSFADFWRRWHITLSTWLRDYLYIPLGGNRLGSARTYAHLMVTMVLGGLWHGASWSFVLWGALHGLLLALERGLARLFSPVPLPAPLRVALVFAAVTWAWVPFRLDDLSRVAAWWVAMAGGAGVGVVDLEALLASAAALGLFFIVPTSVHRWSLRPSVPLLLCTIALFALALLVGYGRAADSPFLYFRF